MAAADVAYLSPHPDDAVFSCGGAIALDVRLGRRVAVVTVYSGTTDAAARRGEDRAAIGRLGATAIDLGLRDASVRAPSRTRGRLFAPLTDAERSEWVGEAREALRAAVGGADVVAPLAVGLHADHQVVHAASASLGGGDRRVRFYEDMPYAFCAPLLARRLAAVGAAPPGPLLPSLWAWLRIAAWWARTPVLRELAPALLVPFAAASLGLRQWPPGRRQRAVKPGRAWAEQRIDVSSVLELKLAAIADYASQWRQFFPGLAAFRSALAGHARRLDAPFAVERLWTREPAPGEVA